MPTEEKKLSKIVFPIDLALSGGGSRAAGFHLGCLSLLNEIKLGDGPENEVAPTLLSQLRALSTVSGGSFTGARFILSLAEGVRFNDFFKDFYHALGSIKVVKKGLEYLAEGKARVPSGRQNLIVSMAQAYADTFLKAKSGNPALFGDILNSPHISLKDVIFNTTEFHYGSTFRFQTSEVPGGNTCMLPIPREAAKNIRLADIVAASSCIPGGFEPIVFPYDFVWSDKNAFDEVRARFPKKGVPLMDGGIYDNLGATSLMSFQELFFDEHEQVGAVIVSDVSPEPRKLYRYPKAIKPSKFPFLRWKMRTHKLILWIIFALSALTVAGFGYRAIAHLGLNWDFFWYLIALVPAFLTFYIILFARIRLGSVGRIVQKAIPQIDERVWDGLQRIPLRKILDMVILRLTSLVTLTSSVFMTRVRELVYDIVDGDEDYAEKHIHCLIYDLHSRHPFDSRITQLGLPEVSGSPLQRVIDCVHELQTEMWYDQPWQLPCLAASGQATLCYSLIRHLLNLYRKLHDKQELRGLTETQLENGLPSDVRWLWKPLTGHWKELVSDPYKILKKYIPDADLPLPPR